MEKNNQLKVDIYVPLDSCACEWDKFMNRVFIVLTPYIKHINYSTRNLNSEEARTLNLHGNSIVVENEKKYNAASSLERDLPSLLKKKGLI